MSNPHSHPNPQITQPATTQEALAALKWQFEMGADEALELEPVNLAKAPPPLPLPELNTQVSAHTPPHAAEAPSPIYKVQDKAAATPAGFTPAPASRPAAPSTLRLPVADLSKILLLEDLKKAMEEIEGLSLRDSAMNLVFGEGQLQPQVMLIGDAPAEEEDRSGRPFIGRAGELLEKMLSALSFTREQVYITNVLPWRPPGNRTPKAEEVAICLPFLMRHIEIVRPKVLLLLGGPTAKALLGKEESVTRMRGVWWDYSSPGLPESVSALVTYHPSNLLSTPLQKRESWRDLRLLKKKIDCV